MWAVCIFAWSLFLTFICSALFLDQKIIAEVEKDFPIDQRPSLFWWNGRAVARAAYRKHAAMFSKQQVARTELRGMGGGCSELDRNIIAQFPSIRILIAVICPGGVRNKVNQG